MLVSACTLVVVLVTATRVEAAAKVMPESIAAGPVQTAEAEPRGNAGSDPTVNARRLARRRRSLDFKGWSPMDVSNPMSDDPTLAYQPPHLGRVHFSNEPISEKPLYPVRPENPTVFVVRTENQEPEYHAVYGTENIEYYHINPQSNTVQAFRSPSFSPGEVSLVSSETDTATTMSTTLPSNEEIIETTDPPVTNLEIPEKEEGFSDKIDTIYEEIETADTELAMENPDGDKDTETDLEGAYSEIRATVLRRPDLVYLLRERNQKFSERTISQPVPQTPVPARRRLDISSTSRNARPALYELLGNKARRSQVAEAPYLGSATDSAGFIRQIPPPNFRYTQRAASSSLSAVTPRSRVRETSARKTTTSGNPWYLIDTRSSLSDRRREPSIASYITPEALSSDNKVHYKPSGPVSYVNKQKKTISDLIDNPHLDDHMNSYKPTLTANSLSELLQIFRYTQVTVPPSKSVVTQVPSTPREFRYTRPTEDPPTTDIFPSSYRYTPSPSDFVDATTETTIIKNPPVAYPDSVADTNSLDGYLFSDSVANPEYARPQVRPNAVVSETKDSSETKNSSKDRGVARGTSKVKINSNLFQRTASTTETPKNPRVINPGLAPARRVAPSPQYVIYQGHSKVKVFGVNSAEDNGWTKYDIRDIFIPTSLISTSRTTTPSPSTTPSTNSTIPATPTPTTTNLYTPITTSTPTSPSTTHLSTGDATLPSTASLPVDQNTTSVVPVTDPAPEDTTTTLYEEEYDEYYYTDGDYGITDFAFGDYGVTDLAFGDYQSEHLTQPLVYISSQLPPPPSVARLVQSPPQTGDIHVQDKESFPDSPIHDPHKLEDTFPLVLSPATALTQAEVPVITLDELSDQQPGASGDGRLPHLRAASSPADTTSTNPAVEGVEESEKSA